jgi:site-specific DNA-cytosine methylase
MNTQMKPLTILSLFDGMSCGRIALERAGIPVKTYYASEVDKHAIKVSSTNWDDIVQIGDVTKVSYKGDVLYTENGNFNVGNIDLVIGGSPCQSISNLGKGEGLDGKSGLFWHFHRILNEVKPKNFILENVSGNKDALVAMNAAMNTEYVEFNSNLVSAQNRKRLFWTNINFSLPPDHEIYLKDILDSSEKETSVLTPGRLRWLLSVKGQECLKKKYAVVDPLRANCLTARSDASWNSNYVTRNGQLTKLSCEEYEKLQTVPVGYTSVVRSSERYKMLGNGWTVDVIVHILKGIINDNTN